MNFLKELPLPYSVGRKREAKSGGRRRYRQPTYFTLKGLERQPDEEKETDIKTYIVCKFSDVTILQLTKILFLFSFTEEGFSPQYKSFCVSTHRHPTPPTYF